MSKDPKKIIDVMKKVVKEKPIVTIKVGISEDGRSAIRRHTASIAEDPEIVEKVMREAGVIRIYGVNEMIDAVAALSRAPLPKGPNVAIVTNARGFEVLSTDLIYEKGLRIAKLSDKTKEELRKYVPPLGTVENPIDLTASMDKEALEKVIEITLRDDNVDCLMFTGQHSSFLPVDTFVKPCTTNKKLADELGKPFMVVITGAFLQQTTSEFIDNGFPTYLTPERTITALANVYEYGRQISTT